MFQEIYYLNHLNEKIDMVSECYSIADVPFASHTWDFETEDSTGVERIKKKKKKLQKQSFLMRVNAGLMSHDDAYNKLINAFETDIIAEIPGKVYVDDQYLECYIYEMSADVIVDGLGSSIHSFKIMPSYPFWVSESSYHFNSTGIVSNDNKSYVGKYGYRYAGGLNSSYIINPHFADSNFKMIIYGPITNPQVTIGKNQHLVYITLEEGEYLEIDSRTGTLVKVLQNGERVNAFHNRQKGKTFFKKIASGRQNISFSNAMIFDLFIYEERSEPKW